MVSLHVTLKKQKPLVNKPEQARSKASRNKPVTQNKPKFQILWTK